MAGDEGELERAKQLRDPRIGKQSPRVAATPCGFRAPGVLIFQCLQPPCFVLCEPYGGAGDDRGDLAGRVGKAVGDATDAAGGQWMSTAAGSLSGSLRTMTSSSRALMSPRARTSLGIGWTPVS